MEMSHLRENQERYRILDATFNPRVHLYRLDGCHLSKIKKEALHDWSSSINQEDPELLHIKEEEELWTIQQTEQAGGREEEITTHQLTTFNVKNEDDEEKHQAPQLQRQTDDSTVADPPTSSSVQQIKLESDETQEQARNPAPKTSWKTAEPSGTEVNNDKDDHFEDWQKPLPDSGADPADSDSGCKTSWAPVSSETSDMKCNTVKIEEKPFACDDCGKRFAHHCHLKRHMTVHTGEKPFACDDCGKRFTQHSHLKRHMTVHTGEKPFVCDDCGKRFTQHSHLKTHMTVHTGEKPFVCDDCGKRFAWSYSLKTHMRIHT